MVDFDDTYWDCSLWLLSELYIMLDNYTEKLQKFAHKTYEARMHIIWFGH